MHFQRVSKLIGYYLWWGYDIVRFRIINIFWYCISFTMSKDKLHRQSTALLKAYFEIQFAIKDLMAAEKILEEMEKNGSTEKPDFVKTIDKYKELIALNEQRVYGMYLSIAGQLYLTKRYKGPINDLFQTFPIGMAIKIEMIRARHFYSQAIALQ